MRSCDSIDRSRFGAFSLIELIAVMSILAILAAAAIPAIRSVTRAAALTTAAEMVADELNRARQTALTQNRSVEVRFYKLPDLFGANPAYRAFRLQIYDEGAPTARALDNLERLAPGVAMLDDQSYSTILNFMANPRVPPANSQPYLEPLPGITAPVAYTFFRFKPDGSTDLDPNGAPNSDQWFLSIKNETDKPVAGKPAGNFATIIVNPVSGRVSTYRP